MRNAVAHRPLLWTCVGLSGSATLLVLFDLLRPSHFVGDMYGLEVTMRLVFLAAPTAVLALGSGAWILGQRSKTRAIHRLGFALVVVATAVLVYQGLATARTRYRDSVRRGYPGKSVAELLRIARDDADSAAVIVLMQKGGSDATEALAGLLLDRSVAFQVRFESAHALGEIGGPEAKRWLETARGQVTEPEIREVIDQALLSFGKRESSDGQVAPALPLTKE